MRGRKLVLVGAAVALAITTAACGGGGGKKGDLTSNKKVNFPAGSTMAKLNEAGKVKIGTKFDQPLFGLKGLDGTMEGFDVEIAKVIASELGIAASNIQWVETPSKIREEAIEKGDVDFVVATYTINDKRKERIAFAGPYYTAGQDIMVRSDDNSITGPESLKGSGKKVCSVSGSTPAEKIKEYADESQIVLFDVYSKCADALKDKQVDAVTTDNVILMGLVANSNGAFKVLSKPFTEEPYGIGVAKDDTDFRMWINDVLEKASKDGRYADAWKKTAGKADSNVPSMPAVNRY
jgi:glutamate transport system substrate-binding protein